MQKDVINILVTFDKNYMMPFEVMLRSMAICNPDETFHIWLLHSEIPGESLRSLMEYCSTMRMTLTPIQVDRSLFANAPVLKQYPQEMYYRMLAPLLLPQNIKRVLYVDPDILVLNSLRPLWDIELKEYVFAAASHTGLFDFMNEVNRVRLDKEHDYFNSGVILMDLEKARSIVKADEIFDCVRKHSKELILPDQDVFNYLYGSYTLQIDDAVWNYDVRYYSAYLLRSNGQCNLDWVIRNTVFLHFCGKKKPWKKSHTSRFGALYKHYMVLTEKILENIF